MLYRKTLSYESLIRTLSTFFFLLPEYRMVAKGQSGEVEGHRVSVKAVKLVGGEDVDEVAKVLVCPSTVVGGEDEDGAGAVPLSRYVHGKLC